MKLTPLDIRKQDFDKSLRGYSPDEVEAFLDMVATQWEEMADERRRLENKVQELENQMEHYKQVEEALQEALDQTRQNAEQQLENAKQEAENIIQEAKTTAQEIKQQAETERAQLVSEAQTIQSRRSEVVARLRAFLTSELEILEEYAEGTQEIESAPRQSAPEEPPDVSPLDGPEAPEPIDEGSSGEPSTSAVEQAAQDIADEADVGTEPVEDEPVETSGAEQGAVDESFQVDEEEDEEEAFAEEFADLQDSLSDVLGDEEMEDPEVGDEGGEEPPEASTVSDLGGLGLDDEDDDRPSGEAEEPSDDRGGVNVEGSSDLEPASAEAEVVVEEEERDEDEGSGSYRSFDDIREEVGEDEAEGGATEPAAGGETETSGDFSSAFDDLDDETGEMDFSGVFDDSSEDDAGPKAQADEASAVDVGTVPATGEAEVEEEPEAEEDVSEEEKDDLERAMRSLFPVLPDEEEVDEGAAGIADEDVPSGDTAPATDTPSGQGEEDTEDEGPSESQFEAIKEDVQKRKSEQEEETDEAGERSTSATDEEEASTEEIEKIWSILEDME